MIHLASWILAKLIYGLRIHGREHIPATGGGLVVCNHVSYVDGILLLAGSRRNIVFMIDSNFVQNGFVGWVLRRLGAVPMPRGGPKAMRAAIEMTIELLKQGYLVGIFPEGYPTRCGVMLPFRRGFERVAQKAGVPIIPACIDRMWGSIFSYFGGKLFWKWSARRSGPVRVSFGTPLPSTATAFQVRSAVENLLADCAIERAKTIRPVHREFVRRTARKPFHHCFIDPADDTKKLNCGKALTAVVCLSRLLKPTLREDAMVGIWLPSSMGGALANLALCLLGKTSVNLNYTAGASVVQSSINQCKIRYVLTSKRFLTKMPCDPGPGVELLSLEDYLPKIGRWSKLFTFLQVLLLPGWLLERSLGIAHHSANDLATVIFSSGSTGEPKGVMLSHGNIAANVDEFAEHINILPTDRMVGILPFFHSFGYTVTLWGPIINGAAAFYLPDPRAAKEVGEAVRKNGGTIMASTATFLRFYIRRCDAEDFKTLRLMVCGAEKLSQTLADEFATKFGIRPLEGYGCTELSPVVSVNMPDMEVAGLKQVRGKNGSIGHPLPGIVCKVVHTETGETLPDDTDGLLLVKGPNVMRGYLGKDELTQQKVRDHWYDTGDIGRIDANGFITLTGRQSRFAKIAGEMVPLERLEEELHAAMNTPDRIVAVAALPDEKRGERIVVLHTTMLDGWSPDRLCTALGERGLPNLWVPDSRDFYPVEAMPILGSGKLDLHQLQKLAAEIAKKR